MIADRLRSAILQAAISGKLTDQRPEDGTATELLEHLAAERATLVKEGKVKKQKPLPPITDDDQPFPLPATWQWVRLGDYAHDRGQQKPTTRFTYIDISAIDNNRQVLNPAALAVLEPEEAPSRARRVGFPGDVVYSTVRPYLHNACIVPDGLDPAPIISTGLAVLTSGSSVSNALLLQTMMSPYFDDLANRTDNARGVAYPAINDNQLRRLPIPVPPLAEQERIIAKLDEVLPLIDQLAVLEREREHLDREFAKAIERAILQAAISGKLTKQHPEDGTAEELLEQIAKERQQLEKEGKIKKQKPLPQVGKADEPFELPESWSWVRLGEIGSWAAGSTPSRSKPELYGGDIPWVKSGEVKQGLIAATEETITKEALISCSVRLNPPGSVLVAMYGANIGDTGMLEVAATTNQAVCACIPFKGVDSGFLRYFVGFSKQHLKKQGAGGAQPNISRTKIIDVPFPLAPQADQSRITTVLDRALPLVREIGELVS